MPRRRPFTLALLLALGAAGCPPSEPPGPPRLEGAVHDIPVYDPGEVDAQLEGESLDGTRSLKVWFVETPHPQERVVAFYERTLSEVEATHRGDGSVSFAYRPLGADARSEIEVHVRSGEVEIVETVPEELRVGDAAPP